MLLAIDLEGCQPAGPYQRDLSRTFGQGMAQSRVIDGHAWWLPSYAPVTANSNYTVSTDTLAGDTVVARREYSSWLRREPTDIYLVRRDIGEAGG